jgi:hypothetical protein
MQALSTTPASDRTAIDRFARERAAGERAADGRASGENATRVEILAPSREDARAGARSYERAAQRAVAFDAWQDEIRRNRRPPEPTTSIRFVAQFVAQHNPGHAAHVENWRGARAAYASADALVSGRGATPGISMLI